MEDFNQIEQNDGNGELNDSNALDYEIPKRPVGEESKETLNIKNIGRPENNDKWELIRKLIQKYDIYQDKRPQNIAERWGLAAIEYTSVIGKRHSTYLLFSICSLLILCFHFFVKRGL